MATMEREPRDNRVAHVSLAWLSYPFYFITNSVVLSMATSITTISGAGLFNALYSPVYDRLTAGSSAAFHRALAMFAAPFALMILRA